jgi:hypothetical protein
MKIQIGGYEAKLKWHNETLRKIIPALEFNFDLIRRKDTKDLHKPGLWQMDLYFLKYFISASYIDRDSGIFKSDPRYQ